MSETINIAGRKAEALAALYNASKPQGMGFLHYKPEKMSTERAQELLDESRDKYFDYLNGRVMKVDLSGDELNPGLYDRDNGDGAARRAIEGEAKAKSFFDRANDMYHEMSVAQGYVPETCTLSGTLVWLLVTKGEDPCAGCNMDRTVCNGRPRSGRYAKEDARLGLQP